MILSGYLLIDPDHQPNLGWIRVVDDRITEIGDGDPPEPAKLGGEGCLICPGFIDAHCHLAQFGAIGFDGMSLRDWLEAVIYPAEAEWADSVLAEQQITLVLGRMLYSGTLGCATYLTSHVHVSETLRHVHERLPLRMIAGRCLMDRNAPAALTGHRAMIPPSSTDRLTYSVNPRFAVACTDDLLAEAGRLAFSGSPVQTHLAEQADECALVQELFPRSAHYTAVYDSFGLLSDRTLLAHCVHLEDDEWKLIADRRSVVVHCPTANMFLESGQFNLDSAREHNVRLALGSDIAAGPDIAMPRVARSMIETAKARRMTTASSAHVPSPAEVWRMITHGNAEALGWNDAGRIEPGAVADLLILRLPFEPDQHLIGRLIYSWSDDFIAHRIVAGRAIN